MREITLTERLSQLLVEKKISGEADSFPTPKFGIDPSKQADEPLKRTDSYTPSTTGANESEPIPMPIAEPSGRVHEAIRRDIFLYNRIVDSIAKKMLRIFYPEGISE